VITDQGYVMVTARGHPRANINGYVLEHILIVEKAIQKPLRRDAQVHHANEIRHDNRPGNLVACHDCAYHNLLHIRMRARAACGNPNWRVCVYCRRYDDPARMTPHNYGRSWRHEECRREYDRKRWARILHGDSDG
jgi:hypothetical protein